MFSFQDALFKISKNCQLWHTDLIIYFPMPQWAKQQTAAFSLNFKEHRKILQHIKDKVSHSYQTRQASFFSSTHELERVLQAH